MKVLRNYYITVKDGKILLTTDIREKTLACSNIFDKLSSVLRSRGFSLIYFTKRNHEEEVYRKGNVIVILLYRECIIRTNMLRNELEALLNKASYYVSASGIM